MKCMHLLLLTMNISIFSMEINFGKYSSLYKQEPKKESNKNLILQSVGGEKFLVSPQTIPLLPVRFRSRGTYTTNFTQYLLRDLIALLNVRTQDKYNLKKIHRVFIAQDYPSNWGMQKHIEGLIDAALDWRHTDLARKLAQYAAYESKDSSSDISFLQKLAEKINKQDACFCPYFFKANNGQIHSLNVFGVCLPKEFIMFPYSHYEYQVPIAISSEQVRNFKQFMRYVDYTAPIARKATNKKAAILNYLHDHPDCITPGMAHLAQACYEFQYAQLITKKLVKKTSEPEIPHLITTMDESTHPYIATELAPSCSLLFWQTEMYDNAIDQNLITNVENSAQLFSSFITYNIYRLLLQYPEFAERMIHRKFLRTELYRILYNIFPGIQKPLRHMHPAYFDKNGPEKQKEFLQVLLQGIKNGMDQKYPDLQKLNIDDLKFHERDLINRIMNDANRVLPEGHSHQERVMATQSVATHALREFFNQEKLAQNSKKLKSMVRIMPFLEALGMPLPLFEVSRLLGPLSMQEWKDMSALRKKLPLVSVIVNNKNGYFFDERVIQTSLVLRNSMLVLPTGNKVIELNNPYLDDLRVFDFVRDSLYEYCRLQHTPDAADTMMKYLQGREIALQSVAVLHTLHMPEVAQCVMHHIYQERCAKESAEFFLKHCQQLSIPEIYIYLAQELAPTLDSIEWLLQNHARAIDLNYLSPESLAKIQGRFASFILQKKDILLERYPLLFKMLEENKNLALLAHHLKSELIKEGYPEELSLSEMVQAQECSICHQFLEPKLQTKRAFLCGHTAFCEDCIGGWLKRKAECPLCRGPV